MHIYRVVGLCFSIWSVSTTPGWAQDNTFTNSVGMEFVLIKPGSMTVGRFQPTANRGGFGGSPLPAGQKPLPDSDYARGEELAKQATTPGFTVKLERPILHLANLR